MFEVRCSDETGTIILKWFNSPRGMTERFKPGIKIVATGVAKKFQSRIEIIHPEITWNAGESLALTDSGSADFGRLVPIYVEIDGIPTRQLRKILWEAVGKYAPTLSEDLPAKYIEAHRLPLLKDAIRRIHFPEEDEGTQEALKEFRTPSHQRLIYEEFLKFEYLVLRRRKNTEKAQAPQLDAPRADQDAKDLTEHFPFGLTGDQKRAVREILADLCAPHPMNRLVQGDVGSGKTAVAFLAAGAVLGQGGQAALMAPTEILAEQHYKNAIKLFGGRLNVALLTGRTPSAERATTLGKLASGQPTLLIGTHALIEESVVFKALNLIMIDEQHRFGVDQRRILRSKGERALDGKKVQPHTLVLSATPIPRTLALTAYGDLAISTIQEMPPGRSPIITRVVRGEARLKAYERIREELKKGHQAYFIYPLVNDSEAEGFTDLKSAVAESERLQREVFPEFKVRLLHGQMKAEEKAAVMAEFSRGEAQVLVSTTVVEVGVDVPNATVIAVEHSERFGLSQLHQLRGRVGRGKVQSHCFFFAPNRTGENTGLRLDVLEQTTDGFKIAEADLEIRGPGEFLGTRQAGTLAFRIANLVRDKEWLLKAREDAQELIDRDPDLQTPQNQPLRRYFEREGKLQSERLRTS